MAGFEIIDTPANVTRYLPHLDGTHTIIRYITRGAPGGSKHIKLPEVRAIKAAGKKLAIVHETWGDFEHAGRGGISKRDGELDGSYSRQIMPKLGAPAGACVYFAVDVEASAAQIKNNVLPYFRAVREAFADGEYTVGIYGPGAVCQAVQDEGLADYFWLANAKGWKGYNAFKPSASIVQRLPTHIAGGLDVDPNDAQVDEWGQFTPFADDAEIVTGVRRLASGEGTADEGAATDTLASMFESAKSLFKSKIAWLAGGLGGTATASTVSTDPEALNLIERLAHKPTFWIAVIAIIVTGMIVFYRWRDHGKGSL